MVPTFTLLSTLRRRLGNHHFSRTMMHVPRGHQVGKGLWVHRGWRTTASMDKSEEMAKRGFRPHVQAWSPDAKPLHQKGFFSPNVLSCPLSSARGISSSSSILWHQCQLLQLPNSGPLGPLALAIPNSCLAWLFGPKKPMNSLISICEDSELTGAGTT